MRPERYYVEYEDAELLRQELALCGGDLLLCDPAHTFTIRDYATLTSAMRAAKRLRGRVVERQNIIDVTPPEDGTGILWEWEDVPLTDWP